MTFHYTKGDGNDTIYGFNETSAISISGDSYQTVQSGNNIVYKIGENTITLVDVAEAQEGIDTDTHKNDENYTYNNQDNVVVNATDDKGSYINNVGNSVTINGGKGKDTVRASGSNISINGGAGNDSIRAKVSGSTVIGGTDDDIIDLTTSQGNNLIVYNAGDGNDTLFNFGDNDTLSISGGSYSSMISNDALILTVGTDSIIIHDADLLSTTNIDGTFSGSSDTQLIRNSTSSPVTVDSDVKDIISFGRTKAVQITGNAKNNSIVGGAGNDTLNGAAGDDTLTGGKGKDVFVFTAGKDVITDYGTGSDKISLASTISDVSISGNDAVLTTRNGGTLTINDGYLVRNSSGKITKKYNKITLAGGKKSTTYIFNNHEMFNRGMNGVTLTSGATNNTLKDLPTKIKTIDATGASSVTSITGNSKANSILASTSDSTLNGGKGNDTLVGNSGKDVFVYKKNEGKDVIQNYAAGDTISIDGAAIDNVFVKKDDVVFKVNGKKLTVKDAADKTITLSENGTAKTFSDGVLYNGNTSAVLAATFYAKSTTTINAASIDATNLKKASKISGNNSANIIVGSKKNDTFYGAGGNDSILGGKGKDVLYGDAGNDTLTGEKGNDKLYGGAGNDILTGGKGKDSLWGDDGADTFIYSKGDGRDVIYGFSNDDTLTLDAVIKDSTVKKDAITLKLSGGAITFKDYTATTFNINSDAYQVKNGALVKK